MYRLHNTSEHGSGVTNMYSISNAASRAATPLQIGGNDHLVLLTTTGELKTYIHCTVLKCTFTKIKYTKETVRLAGVYNHSYHKTPTTYFPIRIGIMF